jgi:hypothetical protein
MSFSRSPLVLRILGATAVSATLLTLAACGDDDDSASGDDFCAQARELDDTSEDIDEAGAVEALRQLDPPDEIADDWNTMVDLLDDMANLDPSDPDVAADQLDQLEEAQAAADNVSAYLEDECGIDAT